MKASGAIEEDSEHGVSKIVTDVLILHSIKFEEGGARFELLFSIAKKLFDEILCRIDIVKIKKKTLRDTYIQKFFKNGIFHNKFTKNRMRRVVKCRKTSYAK